MTGAAIVIIVSLLAIIVMLAIAVGAVLVVLQDDMGLDHDD